MQGERKKTIFTETHTKRDVVCDRSAGKGTRVVIQAS